MSSKTQAILLLELFVIFLLVVSSLKLFTLFIIDIYIWFAIDTSQTTLRRLWRMWTALECLLLLLYQGSSGRDYSSDS